MIPSCMIPLLQLSSRLASKVSRCIANVATWMKDNKLKMNEEKTEVIKIGIQHNLKQVVDVDALTIADCPIPFVDKVKNLVIFLDSTLSFEVQISRLCIVLYLQLQRLGQIRLSQLE